MSVEIGPRTILPATRKNIELHTADGLTLVGELALPPDGRAPVATLVTLHPLPTQGGFMDSHILRKAAWRLPALADVAVLRFNLRGTSSPRGKSEGMFDDGGKERFDVEAAAAFAVDAGLPDRWMLGWSFGTELALKYGLLPGIIGAIVLSPPLSRAKDGDLDAWATDGRPLTVLVPEFDDYLRPEQARERFARVPQAHVIAGIGAKHLWVGEKWARWVLDRVVDVVRPGFGPLAQVWEGPYELYAASHGGPSSDREGHDG